MSCPVVHVEWVETNPASLDIGRPLFVGEASGRVEPDTETRC